ncbi:hypothetical protein J2S09_004014 [Bacillus fengqiuensis]|nr:hypothetical protein [Bacillus fengqiuensis]
MILKALRTKLPITINYYQNGALKTCKGRVCNLNLNDQTLSLKDDKEKVFSIRLAGIKEIY